MEMQRATCRNGHPATFAGANPSYAGSTTLGPAPTEAAYRPVRGLDVDHGARCEASRPTFLLVDGDNRITREHLRAQSH